LGEGLALLEEVVLLLALKLGYLLGEVDLFIGNKFNVRLTGNFVDFACFFACFYLRGF